MLTRNIQKIRIIVCYDHFINYIADIFTALKPCLITLSSNFFGNHILQPVIITYPLTRVSDKACICLYLFFIFAGCIFQIAARNSNSKKAAYCQYKYFFNTHNQPIYCHKPTEKCYIQNLELLSIIF